MGLMLLRPTYSLGILTGLVIAIAYYAKASILPAFAIFGLVFGLQEIGHFLSIRAGRYAEKQYSADSAQRWASFAITLIVFLGLLSPYLIENKQKYGAFFYNQNSTFFIWYDDFDSARADSLQYGYGDGWPDLPQNQIPGVRRYLREHTMAEIIERFRVGANTQVHYSLNALNHINFPLAYLIVLVVIVALNLRHTRQLIWQYKFVAGFACLFFAAYYVLFSWYFPVAGGARFLYGIYLPYIFSVFIALQKMSLGIEPIQLGRVGVKLPTALQIVDRFILALLVANFYYVVTSLLPHGYFGS